MVLLAEFEEFYGWLVTEDLFDEFGFVVGEGEVEAVDGSFFLDLVSFFLVAGFEDALFVDALGFDGCGGECVLLGSAGYGCDFSACVEYCVFLWFPCGGEDFGGEGFGGGDVFEEAV